MNLEDLLGKIAQNLSVGRTFGAAYEKDGTMIIPVALVAGGGGAGEGTSVPESNGEREVDSTATHDAPSNGSGGGFGGVVMPVGVYVVKDEKVRWVPAVSANLVIVVVFILVRMMLRSRIRARRRAA
ncbi:MAG TPA: spore germination protein GerW family protein [Acidimicrobiales bacterium]